MAMNSKAVKTECTENDIWLFSTGNIANCLIFNMVALYIMYYYTNILGVSAAVAGTIFMVARLVDAFTDPLMGMIVDRTNTKKMGKYRPFITYGAPFLGIAFVLMFTTPNISTEGKVIYAYVSYIFYSLTWTCVQIPQLALPIMLSNNVARRTKIQAVFQFCGAIAGLVIQSYALPMIEAMGGTLFPSQMNAACTWEPELVEQMSAVIGQESKAVGINSAMSPVVDVVRDHRWGRVYETYGEDPYLNSQMGIHYVRGMQGDKEHGVACIAKHFLGYSETQGGLNTATTRITDRELYEVFATPFEAAMREADVSSVMANYAEIDGTCVVANKKIAHDLLRDTMKFEGILTSDGAGILKTYTDFKTADTYEEAGFLAKKAGTDTEIPVGASFRQLPKYVRSGQLDESVIDESVRRVLKVKFEYGLFEHPYIDEDKVWDSMNNASKNALSEEIAAKSIVLLKNEGVLPLTKGVKVAVVGPHADSLRYPVSGYTFPAYVEMLAAAGTGEQVSIGGMADEAKKEDETSENNPFAAFSKALDEEGRKKIGDMNQVLRNMGARTLKEVLEERFEVAYAEGCKINTQDESGIAAAVEAAENSDVVIMACGGNCGWINVTGGEGKDRCTLELPGVQHKLLEAVAATGKPVVMVMYGPGIFALESDKVPTDGTIVASCKVKNTGDRSGDEIVQLYYHTKKAHVVRPVKQLAGFVRVHLEAGEEKQVKFLLQTSQLGYYNEDMEFVVEPTRMDVMVGTSAPDGLSRMAGGHGRPERDPLREA